MDLCGRARGLASGLSETVGTRSSPPPGSGRRLAAPLRRCGGERHRLECLETSRGACGAPDDWVAECTGQCVCSGTRWPRSRFNSRSSPRPASPPPAARVAIGAEAAVAIGGGGARRAAPGGEREALRATRPSRKRPRRTRSWSWSAEPDDDALAERATRATTAFPVFRRLRVSFRARAGATATSPWCARLLRQLRTASLGLLAAGRGTGSGTAAPRRVRSRHSFLKGFSRSRGSRVRPGRPALAHGRRVNRRRRLILLLTAFGAGDARYLSRDTGRAVRELVAPAFYSACGPDVPRLAAAARPRAAGPGGHVHGPFWRDLGYAMGMPVAAIADRPAGWRCSWRACGRRGASRGRAQAPGAGAY